MNRPANSNNGNTSLGKRKTTPQNTKVTKKSKKTKGGHIISVTRSNHTTKYHIHLKKIKAGNKSINTANRKKISITRSNHNIPYKVHMKKIEYNEITLQYALNIIKEGNELLTVSKNNRTQTGVKLVSDGNEILYILATKLVESAFDKNIIKNIYIAGTHATLYNYFIIECIKRWLYPPKDKKESSVYLSYENVLKSSMHPCIKHFYKNALNTLIDMNKKIQEISINLLPDIKNKFNNTMKSIYEVTRKYKTNFSSEINAITKIKENTQIQGENQNIILSYIGKIASVIMILVDGYAVINKEWWKSPTDFKGRISAECGNSSGVNSMELSNSNIFKLVKEFHGESKSYDVLTPAHAYMLIDLSIPSQHLNNELYKLDNLSLRDYLMKHIVELWKNQLPQFNFNLLIGSAKHTCTYEIIQNALENIMNYIHKNENDKANELSNNNNKTIKYDNIAHLIAYGFMDVNKDWFEPNDWINNWKQTGKKPSIQSGKIDRLLCNIKSKNNMNLNEKKQHANKVISELLSN